MLEIEPRKYLVNIMQNYHKLLKNPQLQNKTLEIIQKIIKKNN